jgi:hypothetical protein
MMVFEAAPQVKLDVLFADISEHGVRVQDLGVI